MLRAAAVAASALTLAACPAPRGSDGGAIDSGSPDAGSIDAGSDAGSYDAGNGSDAGPHDAGTYACPFDVVFPDAGAPAFLLPCDPSLSAWTSSSLFDADGGLVSPDLVHAGRLGGVWALVDRQPSPGVYVATLYELDGGAWGPSPIGMPDLSWHYAGDPLSRFWGSGPDDLWTADDVWHWDGTVWTRLPGQPMIVFSGFTHASGTRGDDLWLVDSQGSSNTISTVRYWDGGTWADVEQLIEGPDARPYSLIWADAPGSAFLSKPPGIEHLPDKCSASLGFEIGALWGTGSTDVWASGGTYGGGEALFHFDGHTWTQVLAMAFGWIAGSAWNDVWATYAGPSLAHWDGSTWCHAAGAPGIWQVTAANGHAWGVGADGKIWSF